MLYNVFSIDNSNYANITLPDLEWPIIKKLKIFMAGTIIEKQGLV